MACPCCRHSYERAWHVPLSQDGSRRGLPSLRGHATLVTRRGRSLVTNTRKDLELGQKHGHILGKFTVGARRGTAHTLDDGWKTSRDGAPAMGRVRGLDIEELPVGWPWCWEGTWAHGDGTFSQGTPEQRHGAVPGGFPGRSSVWIRGGAKRGGNVIRDTDEPASGAKT